MVELTYFQFAAFIMIFLIIGIGFTWRLERNRYEHLIDIFKTENEKLKAALHEEMLENEELKQKMSNTKKRLNSLYEKK